MWDLAACTLALPGFTGREAGLNASLPLFLHIRLLTRLRLSPLSASTKKGLKARCMQSRRRAAGRVGLSALTRICPCVTLAGLAEHVGLSALAYSNSHSSAAGFRHRTVLPRSSHLFVADGLRDAWKCHRTWFTRSHAELHNISGRGAQAV